MKYSSEEAAICRGESSNRASTKTKFFSLLVKAARFTVPDRMSPKSRRSATLGIKLQYVINHVDNSIRSEQITIRDAHAIYKHAPSPVVPHSQDSAAQRVHGEVVAKQRPIAVHAVDPARVKRAVDHVMLKNICKLVRVDE